MIDLPFQDRADAGRILGAEMALRMSGKNTIVLALPRGGVPVALGVGKALAAPVDVVVVRKLGVPWQPELAMGALCGDLRLLDERLIQELHIPAREVEEAIARETREIERREHVYRGPGPGLNVKHKTVILVDDGLATGSTMCVAVRALHKLGPERILVAVPVASRSAVAKVEAEGCEVVALETPEPFLAVGEWYNDFRQLTDPEVQQMLRHSASEAAVG